MGQMLEIVKALISPTEKLLDIVQKGIGILYEPRHKRKMADAANYEINTIGEALRNNSDIIMGYDKGEVVGKIPEYEELVKRTQYRLTYQELKKQYNIEAVLDCAYSELEKEIEVSPEPVDSDWINRFFDYVGEISSEDMQKIWGKILAGEIKSPGSFSKRTLGVISNLSQQEANVFQKILPLIFCSDNNYFVYSKSELLDKYNIKCEDVLLLDECGLMESSGMLRLNFAMEKDDKDIIYNKNRLVEIVSILDTNKFSIGIYSLTKVAIELLTILEYETDENYLECVVEDIFDNNKNQININVYKRNSILGDQISCEKYPIKILSNNANK